MTLILNGTDNSATTPAVTGTDTDTGVYYPAANQVALATGGTQAMLANSSQGVQFANAIGVGATTPTTSGAGITFPATQSASSDANTLDDYEEGTWTPTWVSTGATWSYSTQYGQYIKVGRFVKAQFYLYATASGTTSNSALLSGLPFTSANLSAFSQDAAPVWFSGSQVVQPLVNNNASTITVWRSQFILVATAADVSGQYFVGTAVYYAAS
jgi:hypothetical protein